MKQIAFQTLTALMVAALPALAQAACYADYKAKRDDPLRLHYGVAEVSGDCSKQSAQAQLSDRLAGDGWTLLTIVSVFGAEGLDERKADAGSFYLRY